MTSIGVFSGSFVRGEQRGGSDIDILVDFSDGPICLTLWVLESLLEEKAWTEGGRRAKLARAQGRDPGVRFEAGFPPRMRDAGLYLKDIVEAIEQIERLSGMDLRGFLADDKTSSAVIRKLEIIGEATERSRADAAKAPGESRGRDGRNEGPADSLLLRRRLSSRLEDGRAAPART